MRLVNGNRVVIVGGGPAGSFTALHLLNFAAQAHLELDIVILEPRDFTQPGPKGCNKCAGILSSTLLNNLKSLELDIPHDVIQAELTNYTLHLSDFTITLQKPDSGRRIASVYRGSGPRLGKPGLTKSFDGWLLGQAIERGACLERIRAQVIEPGERPKIITNQGQEIEADLVVLASGVNSRNPLGAAWNYKPPRTETMAQDEIPVTEDLLDSSVHIFFDYPPGLIFGCVIPKGHYANVSLLGHGLGSKSVGDFLEGHALDKLLIPGMSLLCGCSPKVAVSSAKGYFGDRMVAVGDAAVTRLYKDGIGAAFITAQSATRTIVQRGISRHDFATSYHPVCRRIAIDNSYGKLLFSAWNFTRHSPKFFGIWKRVLLSEAELPPSQQVHSQVLWSMFTGDESYRQIMRILLTRSAMASLLKEGLHS
jgi:flavin-dependent dehydrogenase